jgi:excisionase family DNA binding protein
MSEGSAQSAQKWMLPKPAAATLGVSTRCLRQWAASGKITVALRTRGGHRRYRESDVLALRAELEAVA